MSSFYELRKKLLSQTQSEDAKKQWEDREWGEDTFLGKRKALLQQGEESDKPKKDALSQWINQYNTTMQGISDYDKKRNGGYTQDVSGGFSANVDSLISDFGNISAYADRLGLENSQQYLQALKDLQTSITEQNAYYAQFADEAAYNDHKSRQEGEKNAYTKSFLQDPFADTLGKEYKPNPMLMGKQLDEILVEMSPYLKQKPADVDAYDYLDALSAVGAMDADAKAKYDAKRAESGEDVALNYSLFAAEQMVAAKEKELADYLASDEYKQAEAEYADAVNRGAANFQVAFSTEKQKALESELEYYKKYATDFSEQKAMKKDLSILESWPEEDKKDLETVATYTFGVLSAKGIAAKKRLAEKYGTKVVERVAESYSHYKNAERMASAVEFAQKHGSLGDSIFGIPLRIVGGVTGTLDYIGQGIGKLLGTDTGRYGFDTNTIFQIPSAFGSELMKQDLKEIGQWAGAAAEAQGAGEKVQNTVSDIATTVYSAATNAAENLTRVVATGGVGSLALAATSSFQDAVTSATKQGANPMQAIGMGIISASLETITEKIPLDNLLSSVGKAGSGGWGKVVLEALKQAGVEVTTEEANFIGTTIAEAAILKEKSAYNQMIAEMVAGGMSYADAKKQADKALLQQAGQIAIQTALSGAMSSVGFSVINNQSGKFTDIADQYEQDKQTGKDDLSDILDHIFAKRQPQQQAQTGEQIDGNTTPVLPEMTTTPQQGAHSVNLTAEDLTDIIDEAVAKKHGAPADPIAAALESIANGGTVTNKQAQDIMNNTRAVQRLVKEAGLTELKGTASQNRAAVKDAVLRLSQKQTAVDTAANTNYDNINNLQGGNIYAEGLQQNDRAGSIGDPAQGMAGVQSANRAESQGREQYGGVAVHPGILRVSDALASAQQKRGTTVYPVQDTTASPAAYEQALIAGRESDAKNGWCVTPKSAQELADGNVRTFMNERGTVGVGIAPDGDIVAVFKNQNGGPRKALDTMMPIAIEQGGDRLDCYGNGLAGVYAQYGFIPVARVEFNAEYANEGWTPDKGTPYIYFMMHNGDSAASVAEKMGSYPAITKEQLDALPTYGKDDYDAAMAYRDSLLEQRAGQQNFSDDSAPPSSPTPTQASPDESVGAATGGFTGKQEYYDQLTDENSQPDRPGDVRPMEVLKTDKYGRKVSEFAANAYGAEVTTDEMADRIQELINDGALGFDTRTNAESLENARKAIEEDGLAKTEKAITKSVFDGKVKDGDIEKAMLLYAAYANKKGQANQDRAAELMVDLATMANMTGRNLQLFKLLRKLTPEGQLLAAQKNVQRYVDNLNRKRGKKNHAEVEIPQELQQAYLEAAKKDLDAHTDETAAEKDAILDQIYKVAASQIKGTLAEKLNAWRYMAMLGNIKTQGRNFAGNILFRPFVTAKRTIGTALEMAFLEKENRTKSVLGVGKEALALRAWAQEDAKTTDAKKLFEYSARTGDQTRSQIDDARNIYDTKWLEATRKFVQKVPEAADGIFKRWEYSVSLASFLKARGYTASQITEGKVSDAVLNEARQYAAKEALKATFNDQNAISDAISKRYHGDSEFLKAINLMAEGVLPFRRTPANIAVRAVEYSPVNIVRSAYNLATKVRSGEMSGAEAIDQMASGLTGTAAMALGYALAAGVIPGLKLVGKLDDEEEKSLGHQAYAIEIGGNSYTINWAAPAVIPLFVGANIAQNQGENADAGWFANIVDASKDALNPMIELSCLSSVSDLLENMKYAEKGSELYTIVSSAATSYLSQYIPTLFGHIERGTEGSKMQVYSDAPTALQRSIEKTIGYQTQKIPGLDLFQTKKYDTHGNEVGSQNIFDATLNIGTYGNISTDLVDTEAARLGMPIGKPSSTVSYTDTSGNKHEDQRLTPEQWENMQQVYGQTAYGALEKLVNSKDYAALSDEEKAKAIEFAYDYAREYARGEVLEGHPGVTTGWMKESGDNIANGILQHVAESTFDDAFSSVVSSWKTGNGSDAAISRLDQAYKTFQNLSADMQKSIIANAGGKLEYYLTAKDAGVSTSTFARVYKAFYDIDKSGAKTGEKAAQWSYELEKFKENGTLTAAQKDALKAEMNFWQMIPAETKRFDDLTKSGLDADTSAYVVDLVMGIQPLPGNSGVKDYQKVKAITGADDKLTEEQQKTVLQNYLDEKAYAKYMDILKLGLDNDEYAASYELYATESGEGKKERTIQKFMKKFRMSRKTATALYEIYNPK